MLNVEFEMRNELNKDLLREAENERLIRQIKGRKSMLKNARNVLGRSLVQAGQQLLSER
jgi:hypothetical protein